MKEYCETCEGNGKVFQEGGAGKWKTCNENFVNCPDCNGNGYFENTELERLAEIGRATEKVFHNKTFYMKENGKLKTGIIVVTVNDLLDWAKED